MDKQQTRTIVVRLRPQLGVDGTMAAIEIASAFGGAVDRVGPYFDWRALRAVPAEIVISIPYASNAQYLAVRETVATKRSLTFNSHAHEVQLFVDGKRYVGPPMDDPTTEPPVTVV